MLKKLKIIGLCTVIGFTGVLSGCAGRTPHPIDVYQPDDNQMTCRDLSEEITRNQQDMFKLYPKTQKTGKNVALGVAGAFLIVPWFFMDFSDAEQIEIEAYQRRDMHLHFLAEKKGCGKMPPRLKIIKKKKA